MSKKYFLCGIGGSGMSALARFLHHQGHKVYGSDMSTSKVLDMLQEEGVTTYEMQKSENIISGDFDEFIYSEAIPEGHIERIAAKEKGIPEKKYFEKLSEITEGYLTISVAGTHGKSSTTAMIATMMADAGLNVTAIVGANVHQWGGKNFLSANSDNDDIKKYFVVESCEYRGSFLNLNPYAVVVTNVEPDHLDYFGTPEKYFETFKKFLSKIPEFGVFVANLSDPDLFQIFPENFHPRRGDASEWIKKVPTLQILGGFQRENASMALALAEKLKIPESKAIESIGDFRGLERRFHLKGNRGNILVIDDYAHHPTAIQRTLESVKEYAQEQKRKKIWLVFQPHQYSRTADFFNEFVVSFYKADELLLLDIYESRDSEDDKARVSSEDFARQIKNYLLEHERKESNVWGRGTRKRSGVFYKKQVRYTKDFDTTLGTLIDEAWDGDIVIFMGAGDVHLLADDFLNAEQ